MKLIAPLHGIVGRLCSSLVERLENLLSERIRGEVSEVLNLPANRMIQIRRMVKHGNSDFLAMAVGRGCVLLGIQFGCPIDPCCAASASAFLVDVTLGVDHPPAIVIIEG